MDPGPLASLLSLEPSNEVTDRYAAAKICLSMNFVKLKARPEFDSTKFENLSPGPEDLAEQLVTEDLPEILENMECPTPQEFDAAEAAISEGGPGSNLDPLTLRDMRAYSEENCANIVLTKNEALALGLVVEGTRVVDGASFCLAKGIDLDTIVTINDAIATCDDPFGNHVPGCNLDRMQLPLPHCGESLYRSLGVSSDIADSIASSTYELQASCAARQEAQCMDAREDLLLEEYSVSLKESITLALEEAAATAQAQSQATESNEASSTGGAAALATSALISLLLALVLTALL